MRECAACGEVNPARARFCLGCGHTLDDEPAAVPGLRRSISIIFADLIGSTMLGESLDAEALRHVTATGYAARVIVGEGPPTATSPPTAIQMR